MSEGNSGRTTGPIAECPAMGPNLYEVSMRKAAIDKVKSRLGYQEPQCRNGFIMDGDIVEDVREMGHLLPEKGLLAIEWRGYTENSISTEPSTMSERRVHCECGTTRVRVGGRRIVFMCGDVDEIIVDILALQFYDAGGLIRDLMDSMIWTSRRCDRAMENVISIVAMAANRLIPARDEQACLQSCVLGTIYYYEQYTGPVPPPIWKACVKKFGVTWQTVYECQYKRVIASRSWSRGV